jgi:hypothetical protein
MVRPHERFLVEARHEALRARSLHREAVRHSRHRARSTLRPPAEHRAELEEARRLARMGLEAHRRALAENPWILQLVALYERMRAMRQAWQNRRANAEASARPQEGLRPVAEVGA